MSTAVESTQRAVHRRSVLRAGLAAGAALVLPHHVQACEFFSTTLRIVHPWARETEEGADQAVVCMAFLDVRVADRLIGVETPVAAGAELDGKDVDFPIAQGQESALGETGRVLRLVKLVHPLEVGREYPLRLVFAKGGSVNATLSIDYARGS